MIPEDKKLQLTDLLAIFPTGYTVEGDTDWTRESGLTWWCAYTEAEQISDRVAQKAYIDAKDARKRVIL